MTRKTDNAVLNKGNATNNGKLKNNAKEWDVPHYTPSITQQNILVNQIIERMAKELQYKERSVFMKELNTQNIWSFELGTQEGINIPIWLYIVLQQSDWQHDQNLYNHTFVGLQVISAQVVIGTGKILTVVFY